MIALILGSGIALIFTMVTMPLFIRLLKSKQYGQVVRDDGPTSHATKSGTPTMGGVVVIAAVILSYFVTHGLLSLMGRPSYGITASGLLVLLLFGGMGVVGFLDDFIKIAKKRSLGLRAWEKIVLQAVVGIGFAVLALNFPNGQGLTPASTAISFLRDTNIDLAFAGPALGLVLFVIWSNLIVTATTNGVNLTDGLDGLATGVSIMVFGAYTLIGIWQQNQACGLDMSANVCYTVRDPMDLALLGAILSGALIGFLWWNAKPAKIFMGDTGSLAIGGAVAAFAILSRTQILLLVLAGLFVMITLSVIIQVGFFKLSGGKRVFKMAPLQHHFELSGWAEENVVVRFWILGGLFVAAGLGIFYSEWVVAL
ncbi:phospho-N-acetylmuramoyl-pentapeptide-transferase [Paeniglutamicibacter gangotriensis]|uniref:Phospho-N-acetylmuramoyl-pentapeptide-transferase n=1 Tax=Paeniglutamicibacter gangotriensis Lz1y TaxID=1276920 RepID=M7N8F5_9MICC|nr:phospho-N-acetylmuramoyl-pentapeptide-transferase [Paeniglutamicibacter gangotriensis]EMQ98064.1 phospho-N-acetylmuramoyl-pentapeptide- transferase [Paeniglutamicibacter gangotriensis Lz1y]